MDAISTPSPNSYLDFDGLGQLKGQARTDAKSAIKETAQQFEALFLQMMMKSMRDSIETVSYTHLTLPTNREV